MPNPNKRKLGIVFYSSALVVFSLFFILLMTAFSTWIIGMIFLFFASLAGVLLFIIYLSLTSLIRILRGQYSLEERVSMLEAALNGDNDK